MRGLRWDFTDISFHSGDPVYFRFTVRHLEFRMLLMSDNVGSTHQALNINYVLTLHHAANLQLTVYTICCVNREQYEQLKSVVPG